MKKINLLTFALATFFSLPLLAQDEGSFSFSGSVDTYFRYNANSFNRAIDGDDGLGFSAPATSFANRPGFGLGMVNLISSYEGEKVGFVADLVFGPRGQEAVFNSTGSSNIINQLYVYYNASDAVTLTLGNFNTFLGYEVISPTGNFNYSTSYMFSTGPFSHTGLKADFALADGFSAMLAVMNPTDYTDFNLFDTYTLGAQLGYDNNGVSAYLNFLYGDQDGTLNEDLLPILLDNESLGATFQADLTAGIDLSDDFYLGLNTTINTTGTGEEVAGGDIQDVDGDNFGFYGAALYAQYATSETVSFGARGEYYSLFEGDNSENIIDFTVSSNIALGNLTLIPEVRIDVVSDEDSLGFASRDGETQSSLASFIFAAVYSF
ncbi:outer membrane beta-barrel protein [Tunicatimonas pelagia]|uniref:outer membrane beta-barrel protein n=1 Tax=Tunicatimonas pelagia TaxID=931531 RepID=UPI00266701B5|nr:outer membrane beta-barrel protein [Tunicatimonas pelagia]WKN40899.1 outer membrane beta-barrel protein [Tunicatimonas pelagia]